MARYRGLLVYFVGVILSAVYFLADLRRRRAITGAAMRFGRNDFALLTLLGR